MKINSLEKLRDNGVRIGLDADGDLAIAGGLSLEDAKFIQANYDAILAALKAEAEAEQRAAQATPECIPAEVLETQFEHIPHDEEVQRRRELASARVNGKLSGGQQSEQYLWAHIDAESARQANPQQTEALGGSREPLTSRYRRVRGS